MYSANTIIIIVIYICFNQQIVETVGYGVLNERSVKIVRRAVKTPFVSYDHIVRLKRNAKFDWQKDDSSEEKNDHMDSIHYPSVLVTNYRAMYVNNATPSREQPVSGNGNNSRVGNISDTVVHRDQYRRHNISDIKAILWSDDYDDVMGSNDNQGTLEQTTSYAMEDEISTQPSVIITSVPSTTRIIKHKPTMTTLASTTTTTTTSTTSVPSTEDATVMKTDLKNKDLKSGLYISPEPYANEDMIRIYTLEKDQKYGVGKAKPRLISRKLAEMEVVEYEGRKDSTTTEMIITESSSQTTNTIVVAV